ncbi:hypothetical protein AURDEDRAFT_153294 [Auricularia subglabra TFB-10046 SS5]|nr:hypothetical protein AURDEDRAFT_153294 [Auricularia subglabra TFB-10046 SS5]
MSSAVPRQEQPQQPPTILRGFVYPEEYSVCYEALQDTQRRLAYKDKQYEELAARYEKLSATNRALRTEKKMFLDRIAELEAFRKKYDPTARPEAYPRWQNLNAEDRAAFAHAVGAAHVPGATQVPRNSAPSAAERDAALRAQRESEARRTSDVHAKHPPAPRDEQRPPESERAPKAGPAPKPVMLPPAPVTKARPSHPPQVIRIDNHQAAPTNTSPSAGTKREFVLVDPTQPPQKRKRDASYVQHPHTPQTPVWLGPPLQTHTAPPMPPPVQRPPREAGSPPVGPYGRGPPMPTYSAERSSAIGAMAGDGDAADTSLRHSAARAAPARAAADSDAP